MANPPLCGWDPPNFRSVPLRLACLPRPGVSPPLHMERACLFVFATRRSTIVLSLQTFFLNYLVTMIFLPPHYSPSNVIYRVNVLRAARSVSGCTTMPSKHCRRSLWPRRRCSRLDADMTEASWSSARPCRYMRVFVVCIARGT